MSYKNNNTETALHMNDFFGWNRHPFADSYVQRLLWMSEDDKRKLETIKRILHLGKSTAFYAVRQVPEKRHIYMHRYQSWAIMPDLPVLLLYAGHTRTGLTKSHRPKCYIKGRGNLTVHKNTATGAVKKKGGRFLSRCYQSRD